MRTILLTFAIVSCTSFHSPPKSTKQSPERKTKTDSLAPAVPGRSVYLPFATGTTFTVTQGAFGKDTHNETGNEYSWDLAVPYGTPVNAMESGRVIGVWEPYKGGLCHPSFAEHAHNIKIEHADGTVAQYVHIKSMVEVGDRVKAGQTIATTSQNGFICEPHLHIGIYQSRNHLYYSRQRKTLPLSFRGLPQGLALEGETYEVVEGPSAQ